MFVKIEQQEDDKTVVNEFEIQEIIYPFLLTTATDKQETNHLGDTIDDLKVYLTGEHYFIFNSLNDEFRPVSKKYIQSIKNAIIAQSWAVYDRTTSNQINDRIAEEHQKLFPDQTPSPLSFEKDDKLKITVVNGDDTNKLERRIEELAELCKNKENRGNDWVVLFYNGINELFKILKETVK